MMKKTVLLSALALGLLAPQANAITVDDLDGKLCAQVFIGNHAQYGFADGSHIGKFRKTGTNTIAVDYFMGYYTVEFTLNSANQLTLSIGTSSQRYNQPGTDLGTSQYLQFYNVDGYNVTINNQLYYRYPYVASTTADNTLTSQAYGDVVSSGMKGFSFVPYQLGIATVENGIESDTQWVWYRIHLVVIDNNSTAIQDNEYTYDLKFNVNESDNTVSFENFYDLGMAYENGYSNSSVNWKPIISASYDSTGDFQIPAQIIGGYKNCSFLGFGSLGSYGTGFWFIRDNSKTSNAYSHYMGANGNRGAISGHLSRCGDQPTHFGFNDNSNWVYDDNITGTHLRTLKGDVVELGQIKLYNGDNGTIVDPSTKTIIYQGSEKECTHSVALQNMRMGYGEINTNGGNYLYVEGDIMPGENADYVESYELYVIPGSYKAVTDAAFNNASKGHNNGFSLEDYVYTSAGTVKPNSINLNDEEGAMHFQYAVPEKDLVAAGAKNNQANAYTFYVKTNYTAESGLEPTFHALTAISNTTTGVDDILTGTVNDDDAPVYFYNMNGVLVDGNNLTPGLYIRRQGSTSTKVLIK